MSPADLRTAHDALGISTDFLAERTGLSVSQLWRYEHPSRVRDIPEALAEVVRDLQNDFEVAAQRLAEQYADTEGPIPRYVDLTDFDLAVPEMAGWGSHAQGLLVAEVQRRLERAPYGSQLAIEYIHPDTTEEQS